MPQDLNQVPPDMEVWDVDGSHFLVRYIPGTEPPIPLAWKVASSSDRKALGISKVDRTLSWQEFGKTGVLRHGNTSELLNTTADPWDQIKSNYKTEVRVKPWLADPEVLGVWYASALEGRSITDAELQGTEWWRTHSQSERQWLSLNASDPATAGTMIRDNRTRVADLLRSAGVDNASRSLVQSIADQWTTGSWSEIYATQQIQLLADPARKGKLDGSLKGFRTNLDTTRDQEGTVKDLVATWLGPAISAKWNDERVATWAGRIRNNPDAQLELEENLRSQRLALFPEYTNENLTYEDIAAPWRSVWQQNWGQTADETDPLFMKIVKMNDLAGAEELLRKQGLSRGNETMTNTFLSDINEAFGGQVRRADPALR